MKDDITRAELDALLREVRAADAYARKMEGKYVDAAVVRDAEEAQGCYRATVKEAVRVVNELGRTAVRPDEFLLYVGRFGDFGRKVVENGGKMRVNLFGCANLYADVMLHDAKCTRTGNFDRLEFSRMETLNVFAGKDMADYVKDVNRPRSASEWLELRRRSLEVARAADELLGRLKDGLKRTKDALVERAEAQSEASETLRTGDRT